ncbi:MAG: hypothetical protein Q8R92_16950 [Deltaproteobacteria bacterium]|nr:hypothetical protein [Deltaproteobacteria bacterium]
MATSDVQIANMGLQKLGAARIGSFSDDTKNAEEINACYEVLRDAELRRHNWNFARKRVTLAPSAVDPDFDYDYAFPLPADCLRLLPPAVHGLDWRIESHEGQSSILTNDGATLEVNYIFRVTDPVRFDALFAEMLACRIADHLSESLTQSKAKGEKAMLDYRVARAEARRINAFENISEEAPEDPWLAARR